MKFTYRILLVTYLFSTAPLAQAYVGPGAGLSAIGTIIAFLIAIVLMIVGFIWYPIKRLIKRKKVGSVQDQPLTKSNSVKTDPEQPKQ